MASRDAFSRSAMLALYRKVLKLHKNVLPKVPVCPCSALVDAACACTKLLPGACGGEACAWRQLAARACVRVRNAGRCTTRAQEMRELGDSYARNEFKAHKKAQIGQVCPVRRDMAHTGCCACVYIVAGRPVPMLASCHALWNHAPDPSLALPVQVKLFAKEWKEYVYTIELQAHQGSFGRELDASKVHRDP